MPFIGNQPTSGRFIELDSLTASATANYTLQLNSANFSPESVNNLLVSINGVIQGSSTMSLNGAVLTVGATLSSSDTIDFVRVFGNVGTVSTPTDGSVTANKIGTGAVTSAKIADGTIVNADINADAGISGSKLGTGAVLQVVQGGRTTRVTHNSNTFTDVGVSATITPKSTSSKILVRLEGTIGNSNAGNLTALKLFRDSTEIGSGTGADSYNHFFSYLSSASYTLSSVSQSILDSPSTTSAITYKIQMGAFNATGSLGGRGDGNSIANPTRLTLMEIGG